MNINTMKGKSALLSGFLLMTVMGSSGVAFAERVDFTGSAHINRGTCTFSSGSAGLTYDFGDVTPIVAFAATKSAEKSFTMSNCVGVNNLSLSLSSTSTFTVGSGTYKGQWVIPTATGGATGVAFKTELKNGSNYYPLYADNKTAATGSDKYTQTSTVAIKATIIPTVASASNMTAGSLASSAVLNITYQ